MMSKGIDRRRRLLIAYELTEKPALFDEFKKEMGTRNWHFHQSGQDLPNKTCIAYLELGVSIEDAKYTAKTDLRDSQAAVRKKYSPNFRITRWAFSVTEEGDTITSGTLL